MTFDLAVEGICNAGMKAADRFQRATIMAMADTPMQRKLRSMAPMPVGVVFLPWPGMTEADVRAHMRLMKQTGFNCLKQTMPLLPEWPRDRIYQIALEEGIIPYWYGQGGWQEITPQLLEQIGMDPAMSIDEAMEHPQMIRYQHERMRRRIDAERTARTERKAAEELAVQPTAAMDLEQLRARAHLTPGVVGDVRGHEVHPAAVGAFVAWLQRQYGDVENLKRAWNGDHAGLQGGMLHWRTWEDVAAGIESDVSTRDYRNLRDRMRFRADTYIAEQIVAKFRLQQADDPELPQRAGGEMGIFLPFASRGTDMEGIARAMAEFGSFYPSIHLTWHFEEVQFEIARPVYMQAALTADWAKGIWSATWESSGGPSWFSGGKSPFVEWAQDKTPGFTDAAGGQTILMLSWLAAGYRGFGLWSWNARTAGWESGEFALLDRNRQLTPRAVRAGAIGKAACRYRRELWEADKEPLVGVLQDFDNEAMWAAMAVTGRDHFKAEPIRARIGVSRALINGNIPWEHVTPWQLEQGIGPRYASIYLPAFIALSDSLLSLLTGYVEAGGRLILDMPGAHLDGYGRSLPTAPGSPFERLFGVVLHEYAYARSINNAFHIGTTPLQGFTAVMTPTRAKVLAAYADAGGAAITEHSFGSGTAVVLGAQAALNCALPGNKAMENRIRELCVNDLPLPFQCEGCMVYRLSAPSADHYFLINDAPNRVHVLLNVRAGAAGSCTDAVSGEGVDLSRPFTVEREDGRWLRVLR